MFKLSPPYAHAHTSESTKMALRVNLLVNSSSFYKFTSFVPVRSFSERVSSKPEPSSGPETTGDHLIYTREHFALKESLRKVSRVLASQLTSTRLSCVRQVTGDR